MRFNRSGSATAVDMNMRLVTGLILVVVLAISCNSGDRPAEPAADFKKLDESLKRDEMKRKNLDELFEQAKNKTAVADSFKPVAVMHEQAARFLGKLDSLRVEFRKFCGDQTGEGLPADAGDKKELTNRFFGDPRGAAGWLYDALRNVLNDANKAARSDFSRALVNKLYGSAISRNKDSKTFLEKYFKDVPPTAALTLLGSFETQVRSIEKRVLTDYAGE